MDPFRSKGTPKERTLGGLLSLRAEELGNKVFLMHEDQSFTYRDVDLLSNTLANGLSYLGLEKGDKVAIMLDNCPEFIFVWFALAKIGAVEVPVNTALRGSLLSYMLNHSDSVVLITRAAYLEQLSFVKDEIKGVKQIFVIGETPEKIPGLNIRSFSELLAGQKDNPPAVEVHPQDLMALIYTSGTTGPPKAVMAPHNYFFCAGHGVSGHMMYTEDDVLYTCMPLFHANAQIDTVMPALYCRGKVAVGKRFSASGFWQEIRDYGATEFNAIGVILSILERKEISDEDINNPVRLVYAQPSVDRQAAFEKRFGLKVIELYGTSECGCPVTSAPLDGNRPNSCGKVLRGYQFRVLDENDEELPHGEIGELAVRAMEPFRMFSGYYKMLEASLEAFRNLWYHTGDLGWRDEDGFFYFAGRKKETVRRRGEYVSVNEVERVLCSYPSVSAAAVVGIPSDLGEEDVKACIVTDRSGNLDPVEIMEFCQVRLPYFMVPRYLEFKDELPLTPTGKIEKYKLKDEGVTGRTWDREREGYKLKR